MTGATRGIPYRRQGAVVVADLAGFTALAQSMSRAGTLGSERLHALLDTYFGALIEEVVRAGGQVSSFAGDALTACFERGRNRPRAPALDPAVAAWAAAVAMQSALLNLAVPEGLAAAPRMRVGVGVGQIRRVDGVRVGRQSGRLDVLSGTALALAVSAQQHARPGEVCALSAGWRQDPPDTVRCGEWLVGRAAPPAHRPCPPSRHGGLGDEHRTVTSAFVVLPGTVEDAVAALDGVLATAAPVLARYGGRLRQIDCGDKGCQLVLAFGAPRSAPDDAERAVACCCELTRVGGLRAGVATGRAFAAEVGTAAHREYVVIGDCVNVAARLAATAAPGQVRLDSPTARRCWRFVRLRSLGQVALKGRAAEPVFAVEGLREVVKDAAADDLPFVGRCAELAVLRSLRAAVVGGRGMVCRITGDPGVGKSRLVRQAFGEDARVRWAAAGPPGDERPYRAWHRLVRDLLALPPDADAAQLGEALRAVGVADGVELAARVVAIDAEEVERGGGVGPAELGEATAEIVVQILRRAGRRAPVVVVLEDAHRLDELSAGLLRLLERRASALPILLVAVGRPGAATAPDPFADLTGGYRLDLGPLGVADARELARAALARIRPTRVHRSVSDERAWVDTVVERSGGHPLYLQQLAAWAAEHDGLTGEEVPEDVGRLVLARVDRLVPRSQAALQAASVLAHDVTPAALAACLRVLTHDVDLDGLTRDVRDLVSVQLLTDGATGLGFRDELVREVVYGSLNGEVRAALHDAAGRHLEAENGGDPERVVDELARHAIRARDPQRQQRWVGAAAAASERAFATETAIEYLDLLVPLANGDRGAEADLRLRLGTLLQVNGRWERAEAELRRVLRFAQHAPAHAARAECELGVVLLATTRADEAEGHLRRAARTLPALGLDAEAVRALDRLAFSLVERGDIEAAAQVSARQWTAANTLDEDAARAAACENAALVAWHRGRREEAMSLIRRAHQLAVAGGDLRLVVHTANDLAGLSLGRGDAAGAIEHLIRAIGTAQKIGYSGALAYLTANAGEVYLAHGEVHQARRCYATGVEAALPRGDWATSVQCAIGLAVTAGELRERGHRGLLARATDLAASRGRGPLLLDALLAEAEAAWDDGDIETAWDRAASAESVAEAQAGDVRARALRRCCDALTGRADRAVVRAELDALCAGTDDGASRAIVLAQRAALADDSESRKAAVTACAVAYRRMPSRELRRAHRLLAGVAPAAPAPLPRLVDALVDGPGDVAALLTRVEAAASRSSDRGG